MNFLTETYTMTQDRKGRERLADQESQQRVQANQLKLVKEAVELQNNRMEQAYKRLDTMARLAEGVKDQASHDRARSMLAGIDPDSASQIPAVYDPAWYEQIQSLLNTSKDQLPKVHVIKGRQGNNDVNELVVTDQLGKIISRQTLTSGPAWNPTSGSGGKGSGGKRSGGLTLSQERVNATIESARKQVAAMGNKTRAEWAMHQLNPQVKQLIATANRRKYGEDPSYDALSNAALQAAQKTPPTGKGRLVPDGKGGFIYQK